MMEERIAQDWKTIRSWSQDDDVVEGSYEEM